MLKKYLAQKGPHNKEAKIRVIGKQKEILQNKKAQVRTVSWSLHLQQ